MLAQRAGAANMGMKQRTRMTRYIYARQRQLLSGHELCEQLHRTTQKNAAAYSAPAARSALL